MIYMIIQANSNLMVNELFIIQLIQTDADLNLNSKDIERKILTDGTEGGILSQYIAALFLGINIETLLLDSNTNVFFIRIKKHSIKQ